MIVVLSYKPDPDPALTKHMAVLADSNRGETVVVCSKFTKAEALVCNGRVHKPVRQEAVTRVIVLNYRAPADSGEPSPMAAVRRFNGCWGTDGSGKRVLQAELFPEPSFERKNHDSSRARPRYGTSLL